MYGDTLIQTHDNGVRGSMFLGEESYTYTNGSTVTCEKWSLPFEERVRELKFELVSARQSIAGVLYYLRLTCCFQVACVMLDGTVVYHDQLSFSVVDDDSDDVSGEEKSAVIVYGSIPRPSIR